MWSGGSHHRQVRKCLSREVATEAWLLELAQKGHTLSWAREHQKGSVFPFFIGSLVKGPVQERHQPMAGVLQLQQVPNFIYFL